MFRKQTPCLILLFTSILIAADPQWMNKRLAEWSEQDARDIIYRSPWVGKLTPGMLHVLNANQRREGGNMAAGGGGQGGPGMAALEGVSITGGPKVKAPVAMPGVPESRQTMIVRWESALPIRAAELRAREDGAPELDSDDYAIAVYSVPLKKALVEPKGLADSLRKLSLLRIAGKSPLKPSRVALIEWGGGMATVVYFFPRATPIALEDVRVDFSAQIGQIVLAQSFYPAQMVIQGKLEL
jgi:hypothetical protein